MDFLTFKSFISTEVLIIFYYIGAAILPVGVWFLIAWLIRKYNLVDAAYKKGKETIWKSLNKKQQTKLVISYFPRILILTFRDLSPSRDMISQALFFSGGHAKSSQLRVAPLKGDNF